MFGRAFSAARADGLVMNTMSGDGASKMNGAYSYVFGRFRLHVAEDEELELFCDERKVKISTVEVTILRILLDKPGELRTTAYLLDAVNRSQDANENMVHRAIGTLRRTLKDEHIIENQRGKGYYFTYAVEIRSDAPEPVPPPAPVPPPEPPSPPAVSPEGRQGEAVSAGDDPFVFMASIISFGVLALPFLLAPVTAREKLPIPIGSIQALMILVGFFFCPSVQVEKESVKDSKPFIAVGQLLRSWRWVLLSWCGLYITLTLSNLVGPVSNTATPVGWIILKVLSNLLNNCSALMFFLCYLVLNRRTVLTVRGQSFEDLPTRNGLLVVGAASFVEVVFIILFAKRPENVRLVILGAGLFSGFATGIAMALFTSRLDSRILAGSHLLPIIPILLYFYVIIQPFYPLLDWPFADEGELLRYSNLILVELAFLLKSVMYIYVILLFRSKRFLKYMIHARRFYESIEAELETA
jgi:DNA-binding winged helix-turn-helix (wHTH) protein